MPPTLDFVSWSDHVRHLPRGPVYDYYLEAQKYLRGLEGTLSKLLEAPDGRNPGLYHRIWSEEGTVWQRRRVGEKKFIGLVRAEILRLRGTGFLPSYRNVHRLIGPWRKVLVRCEEVCPRCDRSMKRAASILRAIFHQDDPLHFMYHPLTDGEADNAVYLLEDLASMAASKRLTTKQRHSLLGVALRVGKLPSLPGKPRKIEQKTLARRVDRLNLMVGLRDAIVASKQKFMTRTAFVDDRKQKHQQMIKKETKGEGHQEQAGVQHRPFSIVGATAAYQKYARKVLASLDAQLAAGEVAEYLIEGGHAQTPRGWTGPQMRSFVDRALAETKRLMDTYSAIKQVHDKVKDILHKLEPLSLRKSARGPFVQYCLSRYEEISKGKFHDDEPDFFVHRGDMDDRARSTFELLEMLEKKVLKSSRIRSKMNGQHLEFLLESVVGVAEMQDDDPEAADDHQARLAQDILSVMQLN